VVEVSSTRTSFEAALTAVATFCLPFLRLTLSYVSVSAPERLMTSLKMPSAGCDGSLTSTVMSLPIGPLSRAVRRRAVAPLSSAAASSRWAAG